MYQALYRKYRPTDFNSVVGQDSIIKTLKNSIINHNFSHAYMFFGPRGTGKTTVSKIFARNINCLSPKDGIACQECASCKNSFSKDCVDIIEIDAASNNGVDEIRDLKNKISLVPSDLKYKVYIIDEVHMLSIGAFNALLKTLEEPPAHAIFILATTDPQKVPETIISRCQCFSFKRISETNLINRLKFICEEEKIDIDDEVIKSISLLADGGLRDALGSLDKLVSYCEGRITLNEFEEINGIVSNNDISNLFNYIFEGKVKELLNDLNRFNDNGKNLIQIMVQLLNYSRDIIVDYYLKDLKVDYSLDSIQVLVNLLNEKIFEMKKSGNAKIYIEMLLLKFINDYVFMKKEQNMVVDKNIIVNNTVKNVKNEAISATKKDFEDKNDINNSLKSRIIDTKPDLNVDITTKKEVTTVSKEKPLEIKVKPIKNIEEIMKIRANNTLVKADKNLLKEETNLFGKLNEYLFDSDLGFIVTQLIDSKIRAVSSESIILTFDFDSNVENSYFIFEDINNTYNKITNSNKTISIITSSDWDKLKDDYIKKFKNKENLEYLKEPDPIFEESDNNDIIVSSAAIELFGSDIVEID
ncbi:MAG: DNA polymerase III subunit gamma/tau [Bacilli bacterium]|nr:DNA polymerase III subunit gamma/tau [Bacilli bacterium]